MRLTLGERWYPITTEPLIIGRGDDCSLRIEDAQASRRHALVRGSGDSAFIVDLGSSNGTFVNGRRVSSGRLSTGDEIRIGTTVLAVQTDSAPGCHSVIDTQRLLPRQDEIATERQQSALRSIEFLAARTPPGQRAEMAPSLRTAVDDLLSTMRSRREALLPPEEARVRAVVSRVSTWTAETQAWGPRALASMLELANAPRRAWQPDRHD